MTNNDDMPQVILEEWAASIRWLHAHPEALKGKRALSAMVAAVVEGARAQGKATEGAEEEVMLKVDTNGKRRN